METEINPIEKEARRVELQKLIAEELAKANIPHAKFSNAELLHKYERELAELDGIPFSD